MYILLFVSNHAIFLKRIHKARGTSWQTQIPASAIFQFGLQPDSFQVER